jgi:tetratricopeptide (TPR) repeat protein
VARGTDLAAKVPGWRRLSAISLSSGTGHTRVMAWQIARQAAEDRPVLGWGPNNYYYAFNKHYDPEFLSYGFAETWFDNAHNALLNTLAVQGWLGLICFLALFLTPAAVCVVGFRRGGLDRHLAGFCMAFLIAHLVHLAFAFENPTSYLHFSFLLAMLNRLAGGGRDEEASGLARVPGGALALAVPAALLAVTFGSLLPARANARSFQGALALAEAGAKVERLAASVAEALRRQPELTGGTVASLFQESVAGTYQKTAGGRQIKAAVEAARRKVKDGLDRFDSAMATPTPHGDGTREALAHHAATALPGFRALGWKGEQERLLRSAHRALGELLEQHPRDIRLYLRRARVALELSTVTRDPVPAREAARRLEAAAALSPRRQEVYLELGGLYTTLLEPASALKAYERVIALAPQQSTGYVRLARMLVSMPRTIDRAADPLAAMEQAGARMVPEDHAVLDRVQTHLERHLHSRRVEPPAPGPGYWDRMKQRLQGPQ